jgi:hypothetical protein
MDPREMLPEALVKVDMIFVVGEGARNLLIAFAEAIGVAPPAYRGKPLAVGEALMWRPGEKVVRFSIAETRFLHRRHRRKYSEGDVGPDLSFYFRGSDKKLKLRAQNLILFAQLADGVDEATWRYHLERGDYSRWFRDVIKDDELAAEAKAVEKAAALTAAESRERIREAIAGRYTLPGKDAASATSKQ